MDEEYDEQTIQTEIDKLNGMIEIYGEQLDAIDGALAAINQENDEDSLARQIAEYQGQCERDPKNIPAEDALDTITRAQNALKIIQRHNTVIARETATQQKQLRDRTKELNKITGEHDSIVQKTGWSEKFDMHFTDQDSIRATVQDMKALEVTITKELQGARLIIKKKEQLVLDLNKEVDEAQEQLNKLNQVHNDIRVRERDINDLNAKIDRLMKDDNENDRALAVVESSKGATSLMFMQNDKEFLQETVASVKAVRTQQDALLNAQIKRQDQLQKRLDAIMTSLREMGLQREYERNVVKSALVPSSSRDVPENASQVAPPGEEIPIDVYRLVYKNNEVLQISVARKNMLVLEKEGAIQAMETKLEKYFQSLSLHSKEQDKARRANEMTKEELMERLQEKHREYRTHIDVLLSENAQLKGRLYKMPQSNASAAGGSRRTSTQQKPKRVK